MARAELKFQDLKRELEAARLRAEINGEVTYINSRVSEGDYVDAYQTLGTCPVDVKALDVDFLSSGTLKYLMGTPGIAFLYVRQALIERLHPAMTGWFGRANPFAFQTKTLDWAPTASRFDTGTPPIISAYVSRAGLFVQNQLWDEVPSVVERLKV